LSPTADRSAARAANRTSSALSNPDPRGVDIRTICWAPLGHPRGCRIAPSPLGALERFARCSRVRASRASPGIPIGIALTGEHHRRLLAVFQAVANAGDKGWCRVPGYPLSIT